MGGDGADAAAGCVHRAGGQGRWGKPEWPSRGEMGMSIAWENRGERRWSVQTKLGRKCFQFGQIQLLRNSFLDERAPRYISVAFLFLSRWYYFSINSELTSFLVFYQISVVNHIAAYN
jgi:hypothetical protein